MAEQSYRYPLGTGFFYSPLLVGSSIPLKGDMGAVFGPETQVSKGIIGTGEPPDLARD